VPDVVEQSRDLDGRDGWRRLLHGSHWRSIDPQRQLPYTIEAALNDVIRAERDRHYPGHARENTRLASIDMKEAFDKISEGTYDSVGILFPGMCLLGLAGAEYWDEWLQKDEHRALRQLLCVLARFGLVDAHDHSPEQVHTGPIPCDGVFAGILGRHLPPLSLYVRPDSVAWAPVARRYFEGYKSEWEIRSCSTSEAWARLVEYTKQLGPDLMLVGHNVGFDVSFLKQLAPGGALGDCGISHRSIDTHSLLRVLAWQAKIPEQACTSSGAFAHFGIDVPSEHRHTALGDATAAKELFSKIIWMF
jgi:hypothetical protein